MLFEPLPPLESLLTSSRSLENSRLPGPLAADAMALGCLCLFRPLGQSATGGVAYKQRTFVCFPPSLELTVWDHGVREVKGEPSSSHRLLLMAFHSGRGLMALWGLLSKGANPIHEGSAFMTRSPPNTITLGVRIPT